MRGGILGNKKLVLFIVIFVFIFMLFQLTDVDAFICSVKDNCASNENLILYMYNNVDTHVSKTNSNWPKKLCCTELVDSCSGLSTQLVKLYLSNDGHVSLDNVNYPQQVCLSVYGAVAGQGSITCEPKSSCASDEQCILTLSSNDDAHVSACDVAGSYSNKLCCKATKCPKDFIWDVATKKCVAAFQECSNLDGQKSGGRVCVDIPPYTDAKNSCVRYEPKPYEQACCFATTYNNNDYYKYNNIVVKKDARYNVCTGASFCGGSYELNCKPENDGYCPEDYGDWKTCASLNTGGKCFPCDPDCGKVCTPLTLIPSSPVNPNAQINILASIVNPVLPNELKIYRLSPDETKICTPGYTPQSCLLAKKPFTSADIGAPSKEFINLTLNDIKKITAYGAISYKWSIQSGNDKCEILTTAPDTTSIDLKAIDSGACILRLTNALNNLHYTEATISISRCNSGNDCNDNNACTIDTCKNPGASDSYCSYTNGNTNGQCFVTAYGSYGVCNTAGSCLVPICSSNTICNDNNACTKDSCNNPGQYNAACSITTITSCTNTDGCCAYGCNANIDNDCTAVCGNGIKELGETCSSCSRDVASTEICNGVDDDCDNLIDEGVTNTYYLDNDGDGYGTSSYTTKACRAPEGYVTNSNDCNDNNAQIKPGATEQCNGVDDDCSGGLPASEYNIDGDAYMVCQGDCNDNNAAINPSASDNTCDGVDQNCNYAYDESTPDSRASISGIQNDFTCSNSNAYGTCTGTAYRTCAQASGQTWGSLQSCNAPTPTAYGC